MEWTTRAGPTDFSQSEQNVFEEKIKDRGSRRARGGGQQGPHSGQSETDDGGDNAPFTFSGGQWRRWRSLALIIWVSGAGGSRAPHAADQQVKHTQLVLKRSQSLTRALFNDGKLNKF